MHDEMGDMLFVMANLARHLGLDPEAALRSTNEKFTRRIKRIEEILQQRSLRFDQCDLAELDAIWNQAKAEEKART